MGNALIIIGTLVWLLFLNWLGFFVLPLAVVVIIVGVIIAIPVLWVLYTPFLYLLGFAEGVWEEVFGSK